MSLLTEGFGSKSYFAPDYIFKDVVLANADTTTSAEFAIGGTLAGLEIVGKATTEITVASTQTITYNLVTADVSGGSFNTTHVMKVIPAGTYASGTELFRYVPNTECEVWCKVTCVTSADQSSDKHTVVIERA